MGEALTYLPELIGALGSSVLVTALGFVVGGLLGIPLAIAKAGNVPVVGWLSRGFIELFRNTPLLVQLYLFYFGLGQLGLNVNPFFSTFIGLSLNNAAYTAEIFRAGFESVPTGQREASAALGMTSVQTFIYVVFKPALRNVLPALTNQLIILFLFSSVASIISYQELTNALRNIVSTTELTLPLFAIGAALYYVVSAIAALASRATERFAFRW
ncbi:amino acid ABC transporter permease [Spelaeicoccus albus]|uniref:Polar amino acid transport system permease protein n=1 Tax=Spelaeicoccus albus TaxID=1280376 RepID=A0A7Z0D522_9MICO|nr:amino acid ABC transporter permease [Spelaeicoccus albus]NYI69045.1 polar amino acid transport system permease protein [Spelaeicoccus albus]